MSSEQEHADMVRDLSKSPELIIKQMTPFKASLIHAALGIAGEVGELEQLENLDDHLLEEAGDLLFYCRDARQRLCCATYMYVSPMDYTMAYYAGMFVDVVKKMVIYGQEMDADRLEAAEFALDRIESKLEDMLMLHGFTREQALEHNLMKLAKGPSARYGTGYSDEAAAARVDKQQTYVSMSVGQMEDFTDAQ